MAINKKMLSDLSYFKRRFYIFHAYLTEKQGASFILEQTKGIFELAYQKQDMKKLVKLNKELDVWLIEMLMPSEKEDLLLILETKMGGNSEINYFNQVNEVVSRGEIISEEEYEILLRRVDFIYDKKGSESEVENLNNLLAKFHK